LSVAGCRLPGEAGRDSIFSQSRSFSRVAREKVAEGRMRVSMRGSRCALNCAPATGNRQLGRSSYNKKSVAGYTGNRFLSGTSELIEISCRGR
jgi:hypothetical protein